MTVFDAFKANLDERFPGKVFESARRVPDGQPDAGAYVRDNYLIVSGRRSYVAAERQGRSQAGSFIWDLTVRAVGISPDVVRGMLRETASELVGWIPEVEGRRCFAIRWENGTDVQIETAVTPPLFYADEDYSVRDHPAA